MTGKRLGMLAASLVLTGTVAIGASGCIAVPIGPPGVVIPVPPFIITPAERDHGHYHDGHGHQSRRHGYRPYGRRY